MSADTSLEDPEKLIQYCALHCTTERALFSPKHINKMLELAGRPERVNQWMSLHGDMAELCIQAMANVRRKSITLAVDNTKDQP